MFDFLFLFFEISLPEVAERDPTSQARERATSRPSFAYSLSMPLLLSGGAHLHARLWRAEDEQRDESSRRN